MRICLRSLSQQALGASVATVLTLLASGCGAGIADVSNPAATTSPVSVAVAVPSKLSGRVHGGQQPVTGAAIQLYEVGATGYKTGMAKPLIASTNQTGSVSSVTITAGGSYTSAPAVTFSGGGGSGAAGTAVLTSGAVTSVTITNAGSGYTSAPSVSFDPTYGSGAAGTALTVGSGNALSDANGNFNVTGDYTCDSGTYVYITASGGNPGGNAVNPNIALVAALGPCSQLSSIAFVDVDEVTTVAAAYAMAQFAGNSTFGTPLSSQPGVAGSEAPADNFTTSSTNTQGIANAMAIAQVLANIGTGSSPGSNANGTATPEYWAINTIANILSACVNLTPSTACTTLYENVNPFAGPAYPADTLQAALALAQSPLVSSGGISNLFGLISATSPFQPTATGTTQIHDFTVGISYYPTVASTAILTDPYTVTFDKYGNAWIEMEYGSASTKDYVVELDPTGNPVPAGCTSNCTSSASNYQITSYTCGATCWNYTTSAVGTGTAQNFEGSLSTTSYFQGLAFDTNNNLWVTDWSASDVMVVPGSGAVYTSNGTASTYNGGNAGANGYAVGDSTSSRPTGLAIDGSNDVFITATGGSYPSKPTNSDTNVSTTFKGVLAFIGGSPSSVSADALPATVGPIAISSGTLDTVGGATISGAPFVWVANTGTSASLDLLNSQPSTILAGSYDTSDTTGQGIVAPAGTVGSSNLGTYGIGGASVSSIATNIPNSAGSLYPTNGSDTPTTPISANEDAAMVTDGYGNVWVASITGTVDASAAISNVITKITPNYNNAAPASYAAAGAYDSDFSYVIYHDEAGLNSASSTYCSGTTATQPRFLATDGAGDIWFATSTGNPVGEISNTGTPLSQNYTCPSGVGAGGGFVGITTSGSGSTGCAGSCDFTGTSTGYSRISLSKQLQIDQSGNVWLPKQGNSQPNLTVLVGAAVPVAQPTSVGLASTPVTYGLKP